MQLLAKNAENTVRHSARRAARIRRARNRFRIISAPYCYTLAPRANALPRHGISHRIPDSSKLISKLKEFSLVIATENLSFSDTRGERFSIDRIYINIFALYRANDFCNNLTRGVEILGPTITFARVKLIIPILTARIRNKYIPALKLYDICINAFSIMNAFALRDHTYSDSNFTFAK